MTPRTAGVPQEREPAHKSVADTLVMNLPKRQNSVKVLRPQTAKPVNNKLMEQNYYRT